VSPRPYRPGRRRPAAEQTRARILAAARDLLVAAEGLAGFTIDAVAERAGVARMTVYYRFGSKPGLLEALFDALAAEGGMQDLPTAFRSPEPRAALAAFIATFCRFWAADRLLLRRVRALAVLDPDLEQALRARDERRREGLAVLLHRLARAGEGPAPPAQGAAVDVLHALTSFELYDQLAGPERGPAEVALLLDQLADAVVRPRGE
jgi:AcrR family transcriptional regulator